MIRTISERDDIRRMKMHWMCNMAIDYYSVICDKEWFVKQARVNTIKRDPDRMAMRRKVLDKITELMGNTPGDLIVAATTEMFKSMWCLPGELFIGKCMSFVAVESMGNIIGLMGVAISVPDDPDRDIERQQTTLRSAIYVEE